jgi:hypothetical protein
MESRISGNVRARLLGDYIEDASQGKSPATQARPGGENVRARWIGDFLEDAAQVTPQEPLRSFVVLLKDKREFTVRGTGLQFIPAPASSPDLGSYAILVRRGNHREICVALFHAQELTGIFEGPTNGNGK